MSGAEAGRTYRFNIINFCKAMKRHSRGVERIRPAHTLCPCTGAIPLPAGDATAGLLDASRRRARGGVEAQQQAVAHRRRESRI